ncbi:prion-inhibition and propagation-domain-containing protein [Trichophaea hybrida]|nr:prion-inhibition and propagation-domain-containing protein [Trichophaea hybrida]
MPVDPIGLTLGLASLASLFTTCLDVLDRISSAKSYGSDYELFVTKVETERVRLRLWGEAVNIGGELHERLQDPEVERAVSKLLQQAICFFEDSEGVRLRYGRQDARGFASISGVGSLYILSTDRETSMGVTTAIEHPRGRAETAQKHASTLRKVRWALSGKAKSEKLSQKLEWFVDKLYALVPISRVQVLQQPQQATIQPLVQEVSDQLEVLRPVVGDIALFTSSSGKSRMERRKLESSIRRKKAKHARTGRAAEAERKIRANERMQLQRQAAYFWWCAKLGGTSGSLVFFLTQS